MRATIARVQECLEAKPTSPPWPGPNGTVRLHRDAGVLAAADLAPAMRAACETAAAAAALDQADT